MKFQWEHLPEVQKKASISQNILFSVESGKGVMTTDIPVDFSFCEENEAYKKAYNQSEKAQLLDWSTVAKDKTFNYL
ncbi:hypothetical protein QE152_g19133 [Popillia japonica]|uniref:Uncharacterized protein n=1 Tax=Popillia japonica TaxID=7064 RepID=A0AAW1L0T0_POPJA